MTRWLVRTVTNEIHGPFEQEQLISSIQGGKWQLRDEACRENHYWFAFHEADELYQQLGITWPERLDSDESEEEITDEITDTEVVTKILRVDPQGGQSKPGAERHDPIVFSSREDQAWWSHPALVVFLLIFAAAALAFFLAP